jgi:putative membrane protein insertion efficiency factor
MNLAQQGLLLLLRGYRAIVSPLLTAIGGPMGLGCRFTPTCSVYASEAIREHGAIRGSFLALRRLGRCHPWGGCGCDPVPPKLHFDSSR